MIRETLLLILRLELQLRQFIWHYKKASQAASNLMGKGAYRVVKGEQRILKGDRYGKAAIKRGMSMLQNGIKRMNTARGKSSVVGSLISGFVTGAKNIFRKNFR